MRFKNIIILHGGNEEAEISNVSADYIMNKINQISFGGRKFKPCLINLKNYPNEIELLNFLNENYPPIETYVIPCVHGHPGESGTLPLLLKMYNYKYLGSDFQSSFICFNKISTKLWCEKIGIPTTPFILMSENNYLEDMRKKEALEFFEECNREIFVKTPTQGSSIGCYYVNDKNKLIDGIKKSFKFNDQVILEKKVNARELEVAVFTYNGELICTEPGEVLTEGKFYDYTRKYSKESKIETLTNTTIEPYLKTKIQKYCQLIFKQLGLKDLSRIDFFVDKTDGSLYLNEINTFPGMTPISMFPKMMEEHGIKFQDYILSKLNMGNQHEKN